MAINLWKLQKPTSYNPLSSTAIAINVNPFNTYDFSFKAKSLSGSLIRLSGSATNLTINGVSGNINISTTNELKTYKYEVKTISEGVIAIRDFSGTNDIIIEDIQLVQKPLPKLTINGIDGFRSGKWTLHANAKVIDDETLELNATGTNQHSINEIPVKPNTTYCFDYIRPIGINVAIEERQADLTFIRSLNTNVFTTSKNASVLRIFCSNWSLGVGKYTFKRPMLNLGTTPAPYEPKRGERMVLPVAKGNLIPTDEKMWEQGSISGIGADSVSTTRIRMKGSMLLTKGKQYTLSVKSGYQLTVHYGSANTTWLSPAIFTVDDDGLCRFVVKKTDDSTILPSEITQAQIMLNEGNISQPYTQYAVQLNKKPKRTQIAKQNKPAKAKQNIR